VALAGAAEDGLASASTGLDDLVPIVLQAAVGVAGAVLGLIVLPAWLLTLLTGKRRGGQAIDQRLAGWLRPDFWAIVRMADRAAGTYLRGFDVLAFVVGLLTWIGLTVSPAGRRARVSRALALATLAGIASRSFPNLAPSRLLRPPAGHRPRARGLRGGLRGCQAARWLAGRRR
jgi:predicted PurR-regulated permease PerM